MDYKLILLVVERLKKRATLLEAARQIQKNLAMGLSGFLGEAEEFPLCDQPPGGPSTDYDCETKEPFTCDKAAGFSCGAEHIYDCSNFVCGGTDENPFKCDPIGDFMCSKTYLCKAEHECAAGHIFYCPDAHLCADVFGCNAGAPDMDCDGVPPEDKYDMGDVGEDNNPGDVFCGAQHKDDPKGEDKDAFQCNATFTCNAKDDFGCAETTTFNCGSGAGKGDFDCDPKGGNSTEYVCKDKFNCDNEVSCDSDDPDYDCPHQYTRCNTKGKDCYNEYDCPKSPVECLPRFECHDTVSCPSGYDAP